ncbi:hypothetical protein [uncultured Desulfobacter sp.]|nr:hypothetical protein [uncultured Desulfobacter sp.]
MKNHNDPNKKSDKTPIKKKNVVSEFFDWIAKGTQKANQQGCGPCQS